MIQLVSGFRSFQTFSIVTRIVPTLISVKSKILSIFSSQVWFLIRIRAILQVNFRVIRQVFGIMRSSWGQLRFEAVSLETMPCGRIFSS